MRLPAVEPNEGSLPGQPVSAPDSPAEVLHSPDQTIPAEPAQPPSEARPGMFQKAIFSSTWLARTGDGGLGIGDLEAKSVLALPCPTADSPLLIIPGFAVHYLDGPAGVEMPPRLYDAYCQFRWLHRFSPRWGADVSITPGVYSDFDQEDSEAFRLTGHAVDAWTWCPTTKIIMGVGYFNRLDVKVLPVGGIIWTPSEDWDFELLFPQPKIARRVYWTSAGNERLQEWFYVAAEFGGGDWAFRRSDGTSDLVDLKDYRIYFGLERKKIGGLGARIEVGYVFGRQIEYLRGLPEFDPADTVMLRAGVTY